VEDTTDVQFDDDKDENGAKQQIVNHGEATGPDVLDVVLEEGFPGLVSNRVWSELIQIFLDGAFADVDAEFEQFAANAFCSPQSVFLGYLFDEINDFLGDTGFTVFLA